MTTQTYDNAGALAGVTYSGSSTPNISYVFDRRGRPKTISQNSITTTRTYNDAGQMLKESYSGGVLNGLVITNQYDAYLRRTNNGTVGIDAGYSYNTAGRLDQVANANSTVSMSTTPILEWLIRSHSRRVEPRG